MASTSKLQWFVPPEEHLVLRTSFFKMFLRCPAQAKFRYFDGKIMPPGGAATFGTCVHKSAEHQNRYKLKKGRDIKLSVVQDVFNEEFKLLRKHTKWTQKDNVNKILTHGVDKCVPVYHERAKRFEPLFIEEPIKIVIPEANCTVTGTIDLVEGRNLIRDLKTRGKAPNWLDPIKSLQKVTYTWGFKERFKKNPKGFVLDSLVRKATPEFITSDLMLVDDTDIEKCKQMIIRIVHQVRLGNFYPREEGNMLCSPHMCGYWDICHKGKWMQLPKHGKTFMGNYRPVEELVEDGEL